MRKDQEASAVLDLAREFVDRERRHLPIREAWLFGSWAAGTARADSDIDISVVLEAGTSTACAERIYVDAQLFDPRMESLVFLADEFDRGHRSLLEDIKTKGIRIV